MTAPRWVGIIVAALILCLGTATVRASEGDETVGFYRALNTCVNRCSRAEKLGAHVARVEAGLETPVRTSLADLKTQLAELQSWRTWDLALFRWTCDDNCRYEAMRTDAAERAARGARTVKYYGKWPFTRVLGMQELFSTAFSVANAYPFLQHLSLWRRRAPDSYWMKPLWLGYCVAAINTWVWSTAFHARDTLLTERLDYFCATFSLLFMLFLGIVRVFEIKSRRLWMPLAGLFVIFFLCHCGYLHFVEFDYGYNMTVSVVIGLAYVLLWWGWALAQRSTRIHYAWKIVVANIIIFVFAAFEVFDFPPLWGLLDAHAVWHAATPVSTYLMWSFALEDARFMADRSVYKLL